MPDWRAEARRAARRHGLDPHVFERQIGVESVNYSEDVIHGRRVSPAGAQGIAQIMPATARAWGVNPLHPRQALDKAAEKMAGYVKKYGYEGALRAYNAGEGAIQASHGYAETNRYVQEILHGVSPSPIRKVAGGGSGGSPRAASHGGGGAATGPNLGQGSTITAQLATALQAQASQGPTVSAPAAPKFAAQAPMASVAPQAGVVPAAAIAQRQSIGGLLQQVQGSVDTSGAQHAVVGGGGAGGAGAAGVPHKVGRTLVVGDSLGVGTLPHLEHLLGGRVSGDVKVGRSSPNAVRVLQQKLRGGKYANIVLDTGTNDMTAAELARSVKAARKLAPNARIVLPTLNGPYATKQKNHVLRQLASNDPNIVLVPWHSESRGYLAGDNTHATPQGYARRARLVARALGWQPPVVGGARVHAGSGHVSYVGAAAQGVNHPVKSFLAALAAYTPVAATTGKVGHTKYVSGRPGVVSDHFGGNAEDLGSVANHFPIGGGRGNVIAARAIQLASGISYHRALQIARGGGIHNYYPKSGPWAGRHIQIIWRAADHYDHVHVGVA